MSNKLPLAIIIPTMNRPDTFHRTISLMMSKDYIPSQIIIVDQSNIENRELIKEKLDCYENETEITYLYQEMPSLTKARNAGIKLLNYDIVVFSDDDVDVNDDTLKNIHDVMQDENIAMLAAIDENSKCSKTQLGYLFGTKSFKNRNIGHVTLSMLGRYPDNVKGEVETQWAMGYFFIIRKSLVDKWKIQWDEKLTSYAYAEDLDFSYSYYKKARAENMRCIINDKVRVSHLVSKEYRVPTEKSTYMYVINREYLSYKHNMGIKSRIAVRWTNFGQMLLRLLKNDKPLFMIKAQWKCDMSRKRIKKGILKYE